MLDISQVSFSYGRRGPAVLDDFTLTFEEGGVYGLLGPNGAGKSTLLALIAGLLTPCKGTVALDGTDTRRRIPAVMADIFIVPEEPTLPPLKLDTFMKVYGAMYPSFSADDMKRHLATFEMQGNPRLDRLSMGQRKKVFMSFAMACNTRVLLMDEPTNGLDIPGKAAFRKFVAQNMTDERIFVISTHQVRDVDRLLDHIVIMDSCRVVFSRTVADIQSHIKFVNSTEPGAAAKAVYSMPALGGLSAVLPNDDGTDTDINLELLFDFAMHNPVLLNNMFNQSEKSEK